MSVLALAPVGRRSALGRRVWLRRSAQVALLALVAFAVVGPLVLPDPAVQDLGRYLQGPTWSEPLGRDEFGRSLVSRLAHATRLSLVFAALAVATALLLGTAAGIAAAWFGGWVDALLRAIGAAFVAIPALLIVLVVVALADQGSVLPIYLGLALAQWVEYFFVVRSRAGLVLGSKAVQAARLLDLGTWHVLRRHLWPDLRALLTTIAMLGMVTSILTMSALGYVKVGLKPPRAELGLMITESFPYYSEAPWLSIAPVAVLFVLTVSFLILRDHEKSGS